MGRRAAGLILGALCLVVAGAVLADVAGSWRYHDLWCFYHGGEAVLKHLDPYDGPTWNVLTDDLSRLSGPRIVKAPCPGAFGYPYWSALAFAPLALFPYDAAAGIWGALLIAGIVGGIGFAVRATGAPVALVTALTLGSLPLLQVLVFGQLTGVLLPLAGLSLLPPAARAGASVGLLTLKPQLVVLFGPALTLRSLRGGDVRFPVAAIGVVALLVLASLVVLPSWPLGWARQIVTDRMEIARPMPTAWGLSLLLFGDAAWGLAQAAALLGALALVARGRVFSTPAFGAVVLAVSLFVAPYASGYDQLFLIVPWAVVLASAAGSSSARRRVLLAAVVAIAVVLPWTLVVLRSGSDTLNAVVPALSALLVTVTQPRRPPAAEARTRAAPPSRG